MTTSILLAAALMLTNGAEITPVTPPPMDYTDVIRDTAGMIQDPSARSLARRHGLDILSVTWEDTGRYKASSVGPNISDMTIQVQHRDPRTGAYDLTLMPVIRFPNFSDETGDVALDNFFLLVGNEKGEELRRVTLRQFLGDLRTWLHDPESWDGDRDSLLARRDSHALVSAQACFLPIPEQGTAEFNPVLFNYQSHGDDPAVLTILATREGTSVTIIDNKRDGFEAGYSWGQRLFFNQNGERASLTGMRLSEFLDAGIDDPTATPEAAGSAGLNMVLLIQVPLKQKRPMRLFDMFAMGAVMAAPEAAAYKSESDVENAVIGHGEVEGPFTEIAGLDIERDPRFPVRVTVQFYKATSNGVVSERDMQQIADQIRRVYDEADYAGSLVVGGETGRPTEYDGDKNEPDGWWNAFWKRHEGNTGQTPDDTYDTLRWLLRQGPLAPSL